MKNSPNDVLVVCGLPLAGQDELAQQLQENGWHREALGEQIMAAAKDPNLSAYFERMALDRYKEALGNLGYGGIAMICQPPPGALDGFFVDEVLEHCLRSVRRRLMVAADLKLRTVIDFLGYLKDERQKVLEVLRSDEMGDRFKITAVHMNMPGDACTERIRAIQAIDPKAMEHYDADAVATAEFEPITGDEGFDEILPIGPEDLTTSTLADAGIDVTRRKMDWLQRLRPAAKALRAV